MKIKLTLSVAALAFGGVATVALAAAPAPPPNDNYLDSSSLNEPGTRLNRTETLVDRRDTTSATVQSDVFKPGPGGGPAELTKCEASSYGKTVWYDFYPDVPGLVRMRANGYNAAISVVPFDRKTSLPDFGKRVCIDDSTSTTEELLTPVRKGGSYTVQIGGVNGASGSLEFLFDFLADTDGDGVLDDVDKCKRLPGPRSQAGCPVRLRADATIKAKPTADGIQLLGLGVTVTRGSRVEVRCSRGCRRQVKRKVRRRASFGRLRGTDLPAGSSLVIRVTKRQAIGAYIKYRVLKGNFKKVERCMNPGSRKPRRRCG